MTSDFRQIFQEKFLFVCLFFNQTDLKLGPICDSKSTIFSPGQSAQRKGRHWYKGKAGPSSYPGCSTRDSVLENWGRQRSSGFFWVSQSPSFAHNWRRPEKSEACPLCSTVVAIQSVSHVTIILSTTWSKIKFEKQPSLVSEDGNSKDTSQEQIVLTLDRKCFGCSRNSTELINKQKREYDNRNNKISNKVTVLKKTS